MGRGKASAVASGLADLSVWDFDPSPKVPGTNRVTSLEATEARVLGILSLVPITRISDLAPLDRLGLPAFSAVTPLAKDLTLHMGKGRDVTSAKVSALMEAVERVSAETSPPDRTRRATFNQLARDPEGGSIDPTTLTLPSDSEYHPDRTLTWVRSHDLVTDRPVWMASDLATSPPVEGVLHEVDTNGLAAGNTCLEATVHGLCEVIERDAWSQREFVIEFGAEGSRQPVARWIDQDSLPDDAGSWAERIRSAGMDLALHDITNDLGVATVQALLTDPYFVTPEGSRTAVFFGLGTHPCAATAVFRALSEAVQGRLGVIQGGRDAYNSIPDSTRRHTEARRAAELMPHPGIYFSEIASVWHDDLLSDLRFLIDRVKRAGCERVVVTDLTRPELALPVVRVRVPGLSSFVVNRRRIDWRCLRHLL
jgi:ribosomal protein S12 methylthiotransferase accessory factor